MRTYPESITLARREKWFVVQNGKQVDIHARIFPNNQDSRELTLFGDLDHADATRTVNEHNAMLSELITEAVLNREGW